MLSIQETLVSGRLGVGRESFCRLPMERCAAAPGSAKRTANKGNAAVLVNSPATLRQTCLEALSGAALAGHSSLTYFHTTERPLRRPIFEGAIVS